MHQKSTSWPPPHTIRHSKKSKKISIKISSFGKLEVVLPLSITKELGMEALERHKDWVIFQLDKAKKRKEKKNLSRNSFAKDSAENIIANSISSENVPEFVFLHAGEVFLHFMWGQRQNITVPDINRDIPDAILQSAETLKDNCPSSLASKTTNLPTPALISALDLLEILKTTASTQFIQSFLIPDGNNDYRLNQVKVWLKNYAKTYLGIRLDFLSKKHNLNYSSFRVGWQKTRWGSYSSRGQVNLNIKLIFLPRIMSDAIILHELCHSKEMNHSDAFWLLMESKDSLAREVDARMRLASLWIPEWI